MAARHKKPTPDDTLAIIVELVIWAVKCHAYMDSMLDKARTLSGAKAEHCVRVICVCVILV